jgi:hypothetical protein
VVNPMAVAFHRTGGGTIRQEKGKADVRFRSNLRYLGERNTLCTLLKNYRCTTLMRVLPRYLGLILAQCLMFLFMRKVLLVLSDAKALYWNIVNFRCTYVLHKKVQSMRVVDDEAIQRRMIKGSLKIARWRRLIQ